MKMLKTCFVIGPIGSEGSAIRAAADDFMKYIVSGCPALGEFNYSEPVRADKLSEPGRITSQIIRLLMEADLVIADLTTNNANVYYELSLRHALGKPAIHMAEDSTLLSFDIHDNRTIFYTMNIRSVEAAREELARQIRRVHKAGYKASNPITEAIGIVQLEQSENPAQQVLSTVVRNVELLTAEVHRLAQQQAVGNLRGLVYGGGGGLLDVPPRPTTVAEILGIANPQTRAGTVLASLLAEPPASEPAEKDGSGEPKKKT
jgi:hypothetical protein